MFGRVVRLVPVLTRLACAVVLCIPGCRLPHRSPDTDLEHYVDYATQIDYPSVDQYSDQYAEIASTAAPLTLSNPGESEPWHLTLEEAVHLALQNSEILRDLGGSVLRIPDATDTIYEPALRETDPRYGVEGALSAFDAKWSTQAFVSKNDRALNNRFLGGGTRLLAQDLLNYSTEISKRTAVGTELTARHNVEYDYNNAPGNDDPNKPWMTNLELDIRQPLLQGAGVNFNRIAGPSGAAGVYNGVLIARINTDITLADFEAGVNDFISDVETAYWELYYSYRDLDARIAARDSALDMWQRVNTAMETSVRGGETDREARAREQYYRLQAEVQNALSGRMQEKSRATVFRGVGGIHGNERRLRMLLGLPISDGRLIRPATEPTLAKVVFAWEDVLAEGLTRRVELRRQQWRIKQRELELVAAKNLLLPQLDAFGQYRWRGLGHDLVEPNGTGRPPFNDAVQDLFDGNFQEWQLGVEFSMPIGLRQASAAVRHAELQLHRAQSVLDEQQRVVTYDISQAIAEKDRAYELVQTNLNRRIAADEQLRATEALHDQADQNQLAFLLDRLLDAQRRLADADASYYASLVEYTIAIKQVHYAKGSLLEYNQVYLTEGPWPYDAYHHAAELERLRVTGHPVTGSRNSAPVSLGPYPQQFHTP